MAKRLTEAKLRKLVSDAVRANINRQCHRRFGELAIPEGVRVVGGGIVTAKDEADVRHDDDGHLHDGTARHSDGGERHPAPPDNLG